MKKLIFKPVNKQAMEKTLDWFYSFGKFIYHGQSPSYNGNIFIILTSENMFTVETEDEEKIDMIKLSNLIHIKGFHASDAYWNAWYSVSYNVLERDTSIVELIIGEITIHFWSILPKVCDYTKKNGHRLELRICPNSAIKISEKWKYFYEKELKQFIRVPLDKQYFLDCNFTEESFKKARILNTWKLGLDIIVYSCWHESYGFPKHGIWYGFLLKKWKSGGNTQHRSLEEAIVYASKLRDGSYRLEVEKYNELENLKNGILTLKSALNELLARNGFNDEVIAINKILEDYKLIK